MQSLCSKCTHSIIASGFSNRYQSLIKVDSVKDATCTLWIMASVQWVALSSAALCRTRLRTWMIMSQQRRRTMLAKAGQNAGGTGGRRARNKKTSLELRIITSSSCTEACAEQRCHSPLSLLSWVLLFFWDSSAYNKWRILKSGIFKTTCVNLMWNWWDAVLPCCAVILNSGRKRGWILPDVLF